MISYPQIDPIAIKIGPLAIRWYGLMYLFGFVLSYVLVNYQLKKKSLGLNQEIINSLFYVLILGLIIGGRLGYVLFYNFGFYLNHPLEIVAVWEGGMSFHGALIGTLIAGILFCRKYHLSFWEIADVFVVTVPLGLALGRIGNFTNGELYGRVSNVPWAMVFPNGGPLPRHPSQIYEFLLEGILLFIILWRLKNYQLPSGILLSIFLILYSAFRIIVEFFREPDVQIGFIFNVMTLGQILSLFMLLIGFGLLIYKMHQSRQR